MALPTLSLSIQFIIFITINVFVLYATDKGLITIILVYGDPWQEKNETLRKSLAIQKTASVLKTEKKLPGVVILGVKKCGTTTLGKKHFI